MKEPWVKPALEELDVNGECTAYAGVLRADSSATGLGAARQAPTSRQARDGSPVAREETGRTRSL